MALNPQQYVVYPGSVAPTQTTDSFGGIGEMMSTVMLPMMMMMMMMSMMTPMMKSMASNA